MPEFSSLSWPTLVFPRTALYFSCGLQAGINGTEANFGFGSTIEFREEELLLLRSGYVRELALASYPHIHCGGGDFPLVAGGVCGERRLS